MKRRVVEFDAGPDLFAPPDHLTVRTTDPTPSHAAAERVEATGTARGHRRLILTAIVDHPGRDCRDLAELTGLEAYAVSKRLSELHERGMIAHGIVTTKARRWFVTDFGREALQ